MISSEMSSTRSAGCIRRVALPRKAEKSQAVVELAVMLPILLMLLAVILDFARFVVVHQNISTLTREGASLASRQLDSVASTNFPNTMGVVLSNASPTGLTNDILPVIRVYIGRVLNTTNGAVIQQYQAAGNYSTNAHVLSGGLNGMAQLPADVVFGTNQVVYVIEIFQRFTPWMPLNGPLFDAVFNANAREAVYERAFF